MVNSINRPISPHITIYKPQISTVLSILHRISGAFLFIGLLLVLWWLVCITYISYDLREYFWDFFGTTLGKAILMLWSYTLFLHFCTGIRHLFWDFGKGFSLKSLHISGWIAFVSSVILTGVSWMFIFKYGN
jgi:succinate dehydrogenase / fumarate reductase cytochrome b subunit